MLPHAQSRAVSPFPRLLHHQLSRAGNGADLRQSLRADCGRGAQRPVHRQAREHGDARPAGQQFPTPAQLAAASAEDIFPFIRSISYPNNKAKHLAGLGRMLVQDFGGEVPSTIEELQRLPGVGRKTANVVVSVIYNQPAMAVDTHVFRVSHRLGLVPKTATTPLAVEKGAGAPYSGGADSQSASLADSARPLYLRGPPAPSAPMPAHQLVQVLRRGSQQAGRSSS